MKHSAKEPTGKSFIPDEVETALNKLEEKLNKEFPLGVPRNRIGEATGYVLHPRTCANEDSDKVKCGIKGRFRVGRNIIYPNSGVIEKLRGKIATVEHARSLDSLFFEKRLK